MITRSSLTEITPRLIEGVVMEFRRDVLPRYAKLRSYYEGKSEIAHRVRAAGLPNNRLAHAFPRYITTMASGYLAGQPIKYAMRDGGDQTALDELTRAYDMSNIDSVDSELAKDASIYGKGVCICYVSDKGATRPMTTTIDPRTAFVVYDDTVEHKAMFGVHMYIRKTESGSKSVQVVDVYTDSARYTLTGQSEGGTLTMQDEGTEHFFGGVPIIEFWNNADETGDFEPVISLIDAYDAIESDRVNDKQQFSDAILLLTGCVLENEGERDANGELKDKRSPAQKLLEEKTLSLPDTEAKAEWLIKETDEAGAETLKNAIKTDIHKMSMVPDLTDENFAANASGVAMRYKLIGFENLTMTKERWFKEGLKSRMRLFAHLIAVIGNKTLDVDAVQITFTRALPVNETEIASMVATLSGTVPERILLSQLPFVDDPDDAVEQLQKEKEADIKRQRATFATEYPDANRRSADADDEGETDE